MVFRAQTVEAVSGSKLLERSVAIELSGAIEQIDQV